MKHTFLIAMTALLLVAGLSSCQTEKKGNSIICLPDFSSSRDRSTVEWYRETIKRNILMNMGPKDELTVLPIDFNSETASAEIFTVSFARNDYSNLYGGLQNDEIEAKNHADSVAAQYGKFDSLFEAAYLQRSALPPGTDIIGALRQARKYIVGKNKVNTIVLMCDMLLYVNKETDFEHHLNQDGEIAHYLSLMEKVPLDDCNVIVLTGPQPHIRPEKFQVVKRFWEQYFAQCHAKLLDYSSGATMKVEQALADYSQSK